MIKRKMLVSHLVITIIIMVIISNIEFSQIGYWIIYFLSLILYIVSGFISTAKKSKWYNYFIIAIIGISIWTTCFILSPDNLNYKSEKGGYWFTYQLFIMVSSPLNVIDSVQIILERNKTRQLLIDFIIPIIISLFQYMGGLIKVNLLNKNNNR